MQSHTLPAGRTRVACVVEVVVDSRGLDCIRFERTDLCIGRCCIGLGSTGLGYVDLACVCLGGTDLG